MLWLIAEQRSETKRKISRPRRTNEIYERPQRAGSLHLYEHAMMFPVADRQIVDINSLDLPQN